MKPTEQEIEDQADIAVIKRNNKSLSEMRPFSSELESASGYHSGFKDGFRHAISQMQPEWVSVKTSDDLPKDNRDYWVENQYGEVSLDNGFTMYVRSTKRYTPVVKPQPPKDINQ